MILLQVFFFNEMTYLKKKWNNIILNKNKNKILKLTKLGLSGLVKV